MKNFSKIVLSTLLVLTLVCFSAVTAFAAGNLVVNGKEAAVGSTVNYTFSIGDAQQKLCGIHLVVFFDQDYLKLKDVNTDNLEGGTIVNDNKSNDGRIIITNSFINGTEGLDCSTTTEIVNVTFEVLKEGTTDITYYMPYLYDINSVNIYDYTFTSSLAVDGQVVIDNETPVLQNVEEIENFGDAGDFANNEEGTGSGIKPVVTQAPQAEGSEDSQGSTGEQKGSGAVVPIVCACVIVGAIIALVVVKSISNKKSNDNDEQ
ncbi:MAG: hypothetical protein IJ298_11215 [Ruminococcus sp.]|nr:hypothetical protein [Ruminococcus sp.]